MYSPPDNQRENDLQWDHRESHQCHLVPRESILDQLQCSNVVCSRKCNLTFKCLVHGMRKDCETHVMLQSGCYVLRHSPNRGLTNGLYTPTCVLLHRCITSPLVTYIIVSVDWGGGGVNLVELQHSATTATC